MLRLKLTEEVKELLVHSFCGKVGHLLGSMCNINSPLKPFANGMKEMLVIL